VPAAVEQDAAQVEREEVRLVRGVERAPPVVAELELEHVAVLEGVVRGRVVFRADQQVSTTGWKPAARAARSAASTMTQPWRVSAGPTWISGRTSVLLPKGLQPAAT
jgi:hypothetical protein